MPSCNIPKPLIVLAVGLALTLFGTLLVSLGVEFNPPPQQKCAVESLTSKFYKEFDKCGDPVKFYQCSVSVKPEEVNGSTDPVDLCARYNEQCMYCGKDTVECKTSSSCVDPIRKNCTASFPVGDTIQCYNVSGEYQANPPQFVKDNGPKHPGISGWVFLAIGILLALLGIGGTIDALFRGRPLY